MPNNKNPGDVFNINNLEEAKKILTELLSIMQEITKTGANTSNFFMGNGVNTFMSKYNALAGFFGGQFKQEKRPFQNASKELAQNLKLMDQMIDKDLQRQVIAQKTAIAMAEQEKLKKNSIRLDAERKNLQAKLDREIENATLKFVRDLGKEYDKLPSSAKRKLGSKQSYIDAKADIYTDTLRNSAQQEFESRFVYAKQSGSNITQGDVKNIVRSNSDDFDLDGFNEGADNLNKGAKALEKSVGVLDTFLQNAFGKFFSAFTGGISDQANVYNSTYGELAARAGITNRDQYYNAWSNTANTIRGNGLIDNVGVASVQRQWSELAKTGMSQADIFATALDEVITQKIVPYLDTTSTTFNVLNKRLDGEFVKDIRGINKANLQIAGSNVMTQELLQTIIDQVQPMSDEAIENLAQGSTEVTSMINDLVNNQGWSMEAAKSYVTQLFKNQRYSDQVMRSGSVSERLGLINNMASGVNIYDPTQWNNAIGNYIDTEMALMGGTPGYNTTLGGLQTNIVGSALGVNYANTQAVLQARTRGVTGKSLASNSDLTPSQIKKFSEDSNQDLVDGIYSTEKEMQELTMANLSTEFAQVQTKFGLVGDSLMETLNSVGNKIISAITVGKLFDLLSGNSATLGKLAGFGSSLVAGITVAAVAAAVVTAFSQAAKGEYDTMENRAAAEIKEQLSSSSSSVDQAFADNGAVVQAMAGQASSSQQNWWGTTWSNFGGGMDTMWANLTSSDYLKKNEKFYQWMTSSGVFSTDKSAGTIQRLAAYYLWDKADSLNSIDGVTKKDLQQIAKSGEFDLKSIQAAANALVDAGWAPSNKQGQKVNAVIDFKSYGAPEGSYRSGLDYVPYDGYTATLHEGEAILTATTANELRALVDEYRATNSQSIRFDVIIQEQTNALIGEMERIISVMNTSASPSLTNRLTSKVRESMRDMRSTSSF